MEESVGNPPVRRCRKCGHTKLIAEFVEDPRCRGGHRWQCKGCLAAYDAQRYQQQTQGNLAQNRRWRQRNRARLARYRRAYRKQKAEVMRRIERRKRVKHAARIAVYEQLYSNRRRSRQPREGVVTVQEWRELCARYQHRCVACGQDGPLTVDHVVPLSRGGKHTLDNIQPLCLACNSRKGDQLIDYRQPQIRFA